MLAAQSTEEVGVGAQALADRYHQTEGVQKGILIFLLSQGKLDEQTERPFVFVFMCDFEDISQITAREIFQPVKDAIVERTKKGAVYPYFENGKFDEMIVRVFDDRGETRYWLDFLELGDAPTQFVPLQEATINEWAKDHSQLALEYKKKIDELPDRRSLIDDTAFIKPGDRLSTESLQQLIRAVGDQTGERNVTLQVGNAKVTAPLNEYGRQWGVGHKAGEYFVFLKGDNILTTTRALNPIDLAEIPDLRDAAKRLNITIR
jgi:hypothetical protein